MSEDGPIADTALWLREAREALEDMVTEIRRCQDSLAEQARRDGATWPDIGRMLGMTDEGAKKRIEGHRFQRS